MSKTPHREWLEVGFSAVILIATFYVALYLGIDLPPGATGVAVLAAMALFGDGAGDLLREFMSVPETDADDDESDSTDSSGRV